MILNYSLELGFAQDSTIIKTNQGKTILPLLVKKQKHEEANMEHESKKGNQWYFGYKYHQIIDLKDQLIRFFKLTTASVHDS
ncbi:MAG: transposase [Methanobacteriaceae archaeon]|jgi:IS5 family transposase|nr:transposase [Methanobacteriaceae archaeon]